MLENKSEDPHIRGQAAVALGLLGTRDASDALKVRLADQSEDVNLRLLVLYALTIVKDPYSTGLILETFGGLPLFLRLSAITEFSEFSDQRVTDLLEKIVQDPAEHPATRLAGACSLAQAGDALGTSFLERSEIVSEVINELQGLLASGR